MKIFGYEISKAKTPQNKGSERDILGDIKRKDEKRRRDIIRDVRKQQLHRVRASIDKWLSARQIAENIYSPNNTEKERVYKDILVDAHLTAVMNNLILQCMSNTFSLYDESTGELSEEYNHLFRKKWYRNLIKEYVNSKFHGFSLVQLGNIVNGCFEDSYLVPRHYVIQQKWGVKKNIGNNKDLIPFNDKKFVNWVIPMGDKEDLGLLDKAAPLVIKKKEVIAAWSEGAEIFALPLRYVKTSVSNTQRRENAEDMLENMGTSAWAVVDEEDEIGLLQASRTDISNMYKSFLEFVNSEISKLFLLQTGTTDEKTHVGSAGVMHDVLKMLVKAYVTDMEDITNKIVIPIMQRQGLLPLGVVVKAENEQKLTLMELFSIVKELMPKVKIPSEWLTETFDIPIEEDDTEIDADEETQRILRGSVGGVGSLVLIKQAVANGESDVESAVKIVQYIYGFEEDKAREMIGEIEVKEPEPAPTPDNDPEDEVMEAINKLYNNKDCC